MVLVVIALIAAVVGNVVAHRQDAAAAKAARPAPVSSSVSKSTGESSALPTLCHRSIKAPAQQPWLGTPDARARAEAVWTAHQPDLTQPYVAEKDGWYDWGDVQAANFSQALGRRYLTTAEATRWHDHFAALRDSLSALKIPLVIVITPAKWDVYPEKLPDWAQAIRGSGPLDQLLAGYPDLPIVDLRNPLRKASEEHQTYSKTNSHWTDYGAWVGWKSIAACIDATLPATGGLSAPTIDGVSVTADHNEFAPYGIADAAPNWTVPDYATPLRPVVVTDHTGAMSTVSGDTPTDLLSLPAETRTESSQTDHTALFVRDSYGNALSIPLQQSFAQTWQVRHNLDSTPDTQPDIPALAREYHPDVVILQITERHLNFVPAS
ncbi:hypothetical protein [Glaciihabitans sp. UYNi722]|uniref:alginate O-acetyltransferase AlgX-related protein n=1 Tax=Glaciihabitans sp. UYNi722 TaxID=3156344 RepID=UPI0033964A45